MSREYGKLKIFIRPFRAQPAHILWIFCVFEMRVEKERFFEIFAQYTIVKSRNFIEDKLLSRLIFDKNSFSRIEINNEKKFNLLQLTEKKQAKPNKLFPSLLKIIIMNCDKKRRSRNNSRRLFRGKFWLVVNGMENVTSCTCFPPRRKEENFKLHVCKKHNSLNDSLRPHSIWLCCASSRSVIN